MHIEFHPEDDDAYQVLKCSSTSAFIFSDIKVINFDPTTGTYPTFVKNTAANLVGFKLNIQNSATAGLGNDILDSTGDNYAVDIYLAQADLGTTPAGVKTSAFPATLVTGDLTKGLAATATTTSLQELTANGITLPITGCNLYTWLCACVKEGAGAQYIDSVTTNNCHCQDATSKISCPPGEFIMYQT